MPERDELDQLIDLALATYAEPRSGLERRTLARLSNHAARSARKRWAFPAIAVLTAAALVLLGFLVTKGPRSQSSQMAYAPAITSAPAVSAPAPPETGSSLPHRIRQRGRAVKLTANNAVPRPKLNIFPTPQPPVAGEQALIRFAAEAPEADRRALVEAQPQVDEPLKISAIRIPPLQSLDENH